MTLFANANGLLLAVYNQRSNRQSSRQGGTYALVLMVTSIVFTVSLAGITSVRVMRRTLEQGNDSREALWLAYSGMEHATSLLAITDTWRNTIPNDQNIGWIRFGNGDYRWRLIDEDGDLSNNVNDPLKLVSIGRSGDAIRTLEQILEPTGQGMVALQSAVHCSGNLTVETTKIWEGKFTCNGILTVPAGKVVSGNGQGVIVAGSSINVAGSLQNGSSAVLSGSIPMPSSEVFSMDYYLARATEIDFDDIDDGTGWQGKLLSRLHNPWGQVNPEGIYYVHVPSHDRMEIRDCRISATLLIDLDVGSELQVIENVVWESSLGRFPAMIARALSTQNVKIDFSGTGTLSEAAWGVNFNPLGLPYREMQNENQSDLLPATIRGLFHIIRQPGDTELTTIKGDLPHKTCFLVDGNCLVQGTCFMNDTSIWQDAPPGYVLLPTMKPRPGSLNWIATEP